MSKQETVAQFEKRKDSETKELLRWERQMNKPQGVSYFPILIAVLSIIYIVDEISSNINSAMQSDILFDLFNIASKDVKSPEYAKAIDSLAIMSIITMAFMFLAPFYKSLSDRFGRKPFLAINTVAMAIGMFVVMIAKSAWVYLIGMAILAFVDPNDVQVLYIMETAPTKDRAKICSITKAIALISVSAIGGLRLLYADSTMGWWRKVYIIPVIIAAIVGIMSVFFVRETPVFLEKRTNYLRMTDEERLIQANKIKEGKHAAKGGVLNALKFMLKHRQLRTVCICALIFAGSTIATTYYQSIMASTMTQEQISRAIVIFPFVNGAITLASGFITDGLGRKKSCLILGSLATFCLAGFIIAVKFTGNSIFTGIMYGAFIGGLWSVSDILFLIFPEESSPTELRASIVGIMTLLLGIGMLIAMAIVVVFQNFFDLGWICFAISVPFMAVALFLIMTQVGETKGIDLSTVTGTEWDKPKKRELSDKAD